MEKEIKLRSNIILVWSFLDCLRNCWQPTAAVLKRDAIIFTDDSRKRDASLQYFFRYLYLVSDYDLKQYVKTFFKTSCFCFFRAHSRFFQVAVSGAITRKGEKWLQPPLAKSFRRFNPKIQAFKHVLDLTWKIRGQKGLGNLVLSMTSEFLVIYSKYSWDFKNVQNVIEFVLKLLFLQQNYENRSSTEALPPPEASFVIRLTCISLFSTEPKLDNFCGKQKTKSFWFKPPSLFTKSWFRFWSHLLPQTDFSSLYMGLIQKELKNAAGLKLFFSDMNAKLFK